MTTTTEPPLIDEPTIDVSDMPALDQPDERVCELIDRDDGPCNAPAAWRLTFRDGCRCTNRATSLLLACDDCRRQVEEDTQAAQCFTCFGYLFLLRAEPIR